MPIVRPAIQADLAQLIQLSGKFHQASAYSHVPLSHTDAASALHASIEQGLAVIAREESEPVGMAVGIRTGLPFNTTFPVGAELAWYVEPSARGGGVGRKLRVQLEHQARLAGMKFWSMAVLAHTSPDSAAEQLKAAGYIEFERSYLKVL